MTNSTANLRKLYESTNPLAAMDPWTYEIIDLNTRGFKRAYIKALFVENRQWINHISKYEQIDSREKTSDGLKIEIAGQISRHGFDDRVAYWNEWRNAPSCSGRCTACCDDCPKGYKAIKFSAVGAHGLDADVRRHIERHGPYTKSERKENHVGKPARTELPKRKGNGRLVRDDQRPISGIAKRQRTALRGYNPKDPAVPGT